MICKCPACKNTFEYQDPSINLQSDSVIPMEQEKLCLDCLLGLAEKMVYGKSSRFSSHAEVNNTWQQVA